MRISNPLQTYHRLEVTGLTARTNPVIVISTHDGDPHAAAGSPFQRSQNRLVERRRRRGKVEPEIEQIAEQIQRVPCRDPIEKGDQIALLGRLDRCVVGSQVDVG